MIDEFELFKTIKAFQNKQMLWKLLEKKESTVSDFLQIYLSRINITNSSIPIKIINYLRENSFKSFHSMLNTLMNSSDYNLSLLLITLFISDSDNICFKKEVEIVNFCIKKVYFQTIRRMSAPLPSFILAVPIFR